jgi:hypothetical protein
MRLPLGGHDEAFSHQASEDVEPAES